MATVAELLVKISGDSSGLQKELAASQRQLKRTFGADAMEASRMVVGGMGIMAAAIGGVGVAAVKMAADMEQNRIAFTTMLGSAGAAEAMLSQLATFAEKTPFEFSGLVNSTKRLLAYGYAANEVVPTLTTIGDAVAAMGGSAEVLDRVTLAFGQMKAKGFISGEEMRQLAEAGIPAWQFLANAIGKTIPEAMKLAEDKAIDAEAAMAGMMAQMSQKYGGMMEKQSGTVLGIISNLKDKGGSVMRALGEEITEAMDLKAKLQGALSWMDDFSAKVKGSGVAEAFRDMLPPGMETAIYAISGALLFAMIPALEAATIAAIKLVLALGPIAWAGAAIGIALSQLRDVAPQAKSEMDKLAESTVLMGSAFDNAAASVTNLDMALLNRRNRVEDTGDFALAVSPEAPKVPGPMINGGAGGGADKLIAEAKRVSEAIEREWAQTTKTQLEQLDRWQAEQLADLDKTAAANENYERDKERVAATYATRRMKILQTEAQESLNLQEKIKSGYDNLQTAIKGFDLKGSAKAFADIENEQKSRIKAVADYYKGTQAEFTGADDAKKARILANLDEAGVAYKLNEQGNLDFTRAMAEQEALIRQQTETKKTEYAMQGNAIRAEMEAAYQAYNMEQYMLALDNENAAKLSQLEAQTSMMDLWRQVQMDANMTWSNAMAQIGASAYGGLKTALADFMTGAKTAGDAFASLGKSVLNTLAQIVASWIAGRIAQAAFGKSALTTEMMASKVAAAATAAAWAPAAAAVSLATFGANSAPASAGIVATHAISAGLSIPKMAAGGLTTGPTLAEIGEGRYKEAVLPLSDRVFSKLAAGITQQGGGGTSTVNMYGDINKQSDEESLFESLFTNSRFAMMGA